jgi:hypothetical protein
MSPTLEISVAKSSLRLLDTKVRDMYNDLLPGFITQVSAPSMKGELKEISTVKDEFRQAVRSHLNQFASELTSTEKTQREADLSSTLNVVQAHKFGVLEKMNHFLPPAAPISEFERETIELQKRQLKTQEDAVEIKKEEALAFAKPLKRLVMQKCAELDNELEQLPSSQLQTGDDQQMTRAMLKLAGWKTKMESIRTTFQEFQTTTEDEDEKRQLFSLDTSVWGEQVKWPVFAGDYGEDFFKFKLDHKA